MKNTWKDNKSEKMRLHIDLSDVIDGEKGTFRYYIYLKDLCGVHLDISILKTCVGYIKISLRSIFNKDLCGVHLVAV